MHCDQAAVSKSIVEALSGLDVSNEQEDERETAQKEFDVATTELKKRINNARTEIAAQGMRGKRLDGALESRVAPLQEALDQKKKAWLEALKKSVPRPELALGKHIKCTPEEFRDHVSNFLENSDFNRREPLDLLAAFASDGCFDKKKGCVDVTPFCFITGSGHQYFLDTVRQLIKEVDLELVIQALFHPWTYQDEKFSMRWDPTEDRQYALMDRNPTAKDNKARTVWMANLLAYQALALFSSAPSMRSLKTTGWTPDKDGPRFTWPIWQHPIDIDAIRSLLLLTELQKPDPNSLDLRDRGIVAAFRVRRIQVGSPPLYKINFSPSIEI